MLLWANQLYMVNLPSQTVRLPECQLHLKIHPTTQGADNINQLIASSAGPEIHLGSHPGGWSHDREGTSVRVCVCHMHIMFIIL